VERKKAAGRRGRGDASPTNKEQRATVDRRLPGIDEERLMDLGLTRREVAVLELVAQGRTNEQIGEALGLSPLTVKKHLERMSVKLGAANRAALVAVAWQRSSAPQGSARRNRQPKA
jgi:DNA-binding NarL/FixJ family response regulator